MIQIVKGSIRHLDLAVVVEDTQQECESSVLFIQFSMNSNSSLKKCLEYTAKLLGLKPVAAETPINISKMTWTPVSPSIPQFLLITGST